MSERIRRALGFTAILGCASIAQAGPDWVEGDHGDAGTLPVTSQTIDMSNSPTGAINKISGRLTGPATTLGGSSDFQDMFKFRILVPTNFCATTACIDGVPCGAQFDPRLFLFNVNGIGITGADDSFGIGVVGTIVDDPYLTGQSCDGSGSMVLAPGDYLLAITNSLNSPISAGGDIFCFGCPNKGTPTCGLGLTEISGNDGPGGTQPITGWFENPGSDSAIGPGAPCDGCGDYAITLCLGTVGIVVEETIQAKMDIKPGSCPNPFNRTSNGVLPISLLGSATFDVHDVDLETVRISRDGSAGSIGPNENPPGPQSQYENNAGPTAGVECGCGATSSDSYVDLSMKFRSDALVSALELNSLSAGALVTLKITGELENGTPFEASDCIRLVPPGTPPGMIAVNSPAGAFIDSSPLDLTLDGGGFGAFQRDFPVTTVVTLKAPISLPGKMLAGWKVDGNPQLIVKQKIELTVTSSTHVYEAVYVPTPIKR